MRTRKLTRRQKSGGRPAVSRYRQKQLQGGTAAMQEAFSNAYEKARGQAGSHAGRSETPPQARCRRQGGHSSDEF